MDKILALTLSDTTTTHKFDMIVVSWVHTSANRRYIEISATHPELGFRLVRITATGGLEEQRRLSEFHDKLIASLGRLNTQITAYIDSATLPPHDVEVNLRRRLVYLIVVP